MQQIVRQVLGENAKVIGCLNCGEVETLYEGAEHHCGGQSGPYAATLSVGQLPGKPAVLAQRE